MGEDRHGNLFWYFGGIHLYKQMVASDQWRVIARSKTDWLKAGFENMTKNTLLNDS